MKILQSISIVAALSLLPVVARAGDGELYYRTRISVDVTGLAGARDAEHDQQDKSSMAAELRLLLEEHHVVLVDDAESAQVTVSLQWVDYDASIYSVGIEVRRPDGVTLKLEEFDCHCMNPSEIAPEVNTRLLDVLAMLERPKPAVDPEPVGPEPVGTGPDRVQKSASVGPATWAGAALMVVGVGATVVGGVFVGRGRSANSAAVGDQAIDETEYRTPGVISISVGAGALLAGAALVAVDQTVLKRRRSASKVSLLPVVHPRGAGLSLRGRF